MINYASIPETGRGCVILKSWSSKHPAGVSFRLLIDIIHQLVHTKQASSAGMLPLASPAAAFNFHKMQHQQALASSGIPHCLAGWQRGISVISCSLLRRWYQ